MALCVCLCACLPVFAVYARLFVATPACTELTFDLRFCIKGKWWEKHLSDILSLAPFFFPWGQSQVQPAVLLPSLSSLQLLSLSLIRSFSHLSCKKAHGCLLDLVLYQIKLYSTCLPECCSLHGCTLTQSECCRLLVPCWGERTLSLSYSRRWVWELQISSEYFLEIPYFISILGQCRWSHARSYRITC